MVLEKNHIFKIKSILDKMEELVFSTYDPKKYKLCAEYYKDTTMDTLHDDLTIWLVEEDKNKITKTMLDWELYLNV